MSSITVLYMQQRVDEAFGRVVRKHREQRNLSQRALAERLAELGLSLDPSAVTRIEGGKRPVRLSEAEIIARALRASLQGMIHEATEASAGARENRIETVLAVLRGYVESIDDIVSLIPQDFENAATEIEDAEGEVSDEDYQRFVESYNELLGTVRESLETGLVVFGTKDKAHGE